MLARNDVAVLVLLISVAWLAGWHLVTRWENTNHTEARRRELEAEREARASRGARPFAWRVWEIGARTGLVLVPTSSSPMGWVFRSVFCTHRRLPTSVLLRYHSRSLASPAPQPGW